MISQRVPGVLEIVQLRQVLFNLRDALRVDDLEGVARARVAADVESALELEHDTSSMIFLRAIMCAVPSSSRMPLWRKVPPLPPSVIQFAWPAWYSSMRFVISSSSAFDCRQYASKLEYFMGTSI